MQVSQMERERGDGGSMEERLKFRGGNIGFGRTEPICIMTDTCIVCICIGEKSGRNLLMV